MTDYEYVLIKCKRAHYDKWTQKAIDACVEKLQNFTRPELLRLFTSRWLDRNDEVRKVIFAKLYRTELDQIENFIHESPIEELGPMLAEQNGKYPKLIREELKARYNASDHDTQMRIIGYFLKSRSKQDRQWGEVREKWQKRGFANPPSIFDSWKK